MACSLFLSEANCFLSQISQISQIYSMGYGAQSKYLRYLRHLRDIIFLRENNIFARNNKK